MPLGRNDGTCVKIYVEAMKNSLPKADASKPKPEDPPEIPTQDEHLGNVAKPFGEAFFNLATKKAEVFSNQVLDKEFWEWVADVNSWLKQQKKVDESLQQWIEGSLQPQQMAVLLSELKKVGHPPNAPNELRGGIR